MLTRGLRDPISERLRRLAHAAVRETARLVLLFMVATLGLAAIWRLIDLWQAIAASLAPAWCAGIALAVATAIAGVIFWRDPARRRWRANAGTSAGRYAHPSPAHHLYLSARRGPDGGSRRASR